MGPLGGCVIWKVLFGWCFARWLMHGVCLKVGAKFKLILFAIRSGQIGFIKGRCSGSRLVGSRGSSNANAIVGATM